MHNNTLHKYSTLKMNDSNDNQTKHTAITYTHTRNDKLPKYLNLKMNN